MRARSSRNPACVLGLDREQAIDDRLDRSRRRSREQLRRQPRRDQPRVMLACVASIVNASSARATDRTALRRATARTRRRSTPLVDEELVSLVRRDRVDRVGGALDVDAGTERALLGEQRGDARWAEVAPRLRVREEVREIGIRTRRAAGSRRRAGRPAVPSYGCGSRSRRSGGPDPSRPSAPAPTAIRSVASRDRRHRPHARARTPPRAPPASTRRSGRSSARAARRRRRSSAAMSPRTPRVENSSSAASAIRRRVAGVPLRRRDEDHGVECAHGP